MTSSIAVPDQNDAPSPYAGKKRVAVYVDPLVHKRLKAMSAHTETPIVHLVEAWIVAGTQSWLTQERERRGL